MRVLYEGGLLSGKKYTSIRNTKDVVEESGKNCKNKKKKAKKVEALKAKLRDPSGKERSNVTQLQSDKSRALA